MKSITALMNVNTRVGPGTVYDKKTQVRRGTTLEYDQTLKDGANIIWYHTNKGWISGRFVSNADDIKNRVSSEDKIMNLQNFDDEASMGEFKQIDSASSSGSEDTSLTNYDGGTSVASSDTDIVLAKRIFGLPYQWLPDTDVPLNKIHGKSLADGELGYNYYEALMETPILSVIPGLPDFLPDVSGSEKESLTTHIENMVKGIADLEGDFGKRVLEGTTPGDMVTRFFSFKTCYSQFARYFNTMCQMNALMMGLGNEVLPGFPNDENHQFRAFNWTAYTMANKYVGRRTNDPKANDQNYYFDTSGTIHKATDLAGSAWNALTGNDSGEAVQIKTISDQYYTDFVINPRVGYSDELSNSSGQSMIANLFSGASDMTKEIQFLLNSVEGMTDRVGSTADKAGEAIKTLGEQSTGLMSDVIKKVSSSASTILSGANLIFPDIWKGSNYQRNFNIEIKLSTPYGTPRNIFLDILVPLWFWICLTAPRQASPNSYMSPFLCRCHVPGIFSVTNGLVSGLSIRKGGDDSAWSVDGFPLEVTLSVQITDLYHELSISSLNGVAFDDAKNFFWNDALIDYVSVQSGLNMKSHEFAIKAAVAKNLISEQPKELIKRVPDLITEKLSMMMSGMRL